MSRISDGAEAAAGFLMQISTSFDKLRSCTVSPVRPLRGPVEVYSVFVHIRLANQMLMLVSGRVARQGSYRMVISVELAYNKEADYPSPLFFFQPQAQIQAFTYTVPFELLLDVNTM